MPDKHTQYFDKKIYWTDEIDGCGNTMIDDFLDATSFISGDRKFFNGVVARASGDLVYYLQEWLKR